MNNLHICLFNSTSECSSATAKIFLDYANFFADKGHHVSLFFHRRPECPKQQHPNIKIYTFPKWLPILKGAAWFNPFEITLRIWAVLKNRYDVIHVLPGHRPSHFFPAVLSKLLFKTLIIDEWWEWFGPEGIGEGIKQTGTGHFYTWYEKTFELRCKKYYDIIFPISEGLVKRLPKQIQKKCTVLHGGMDDKKLIPYNLKTARQAVELDTKYFVVGMSNICKLDHPDNIPLFQAFSLFAQKHDNAKLLVSGEESYISTDIISLVGKNTVINIGWQSFTKYNQYLSSCDLFVLPFPSTNRNIGRWPNKLGDYVWLKRPVITNPTGELNKIIHKGQLGYCNKNTQKDYLISLEQAYIDWKKKTLPIIDPDKSGLITITQRKEMILKIYKSNLHTSRNNVEKTNAH